MKKLVAVRRLSQTIFAILFIHILWSATYPLQGHFPADIFFKIDPLIMIFTSISERIVLNGIILSLAMIALTLLLGRFFCGWICPLGSIIDVCGRARKKNNFPHDAANAKIRSVKYYILGAVALASLSGIQCAWIIDPLVIMARFVSLNLIPSVTYIVNALFIFLIRDLQSAGPVRDLYHTLKHSFLGVQVYYFSHSGIIFLFFLFILSMVFIMKRFWCRCLCPLGALYAIPARFSLLHRVVENCSKCLACRDNCRMGAIKDNIDYLKGECILCMDCIYDYPVHNTKFIWPAIGKKKESTKSILSGNKGALSRRQVLLLLASSGFLAGFRKNLITKQRKIRTVIRPPAALSEEHFTERCIRCGNCMKVCITNGLQPVMLQSGFEGIWTPQLVPEIGYCEYQCTLCGNVCPTAAIKRVSVKEKKITRLGLARVNRPLCLPWSKNEPCIVCEEHCPVPAKAIKLQRREANGNALLAPVVDFGLCIGCGICQYTCPVRPIRAIKVSPQ